ncbi:MAG: hypothetical protein U0169_21360 [Polyangiaceae bacterium]
MGIGRLVTAASCFVVCALGASASLAAPANTPAEVTAAAVPVPQASERPELVLPAGLYFRSGHFEMAACTGCKAPKVVATAGIFANAKEAENAVKTLAEGALPVGYPWVVHTDELGLADPSMRGIAVVTGLFASYEDANAWRAANTVSVANARLTALADDDEYGERSRKGVDSDFQRSIVVQLDASEDVPAYSEEDLARIEKTSAFEPQDLAALAPKCRVSGKSVFTFPRERNRGSELVTRFHRAMVPVRCGRSVAFVPGSSTRFETVVGRGKDGRGFLRQVVDVVSDEPRVLEWRLDVAARPGTRGKSHVFRRATGS